MTRAVAAKKQVLPLVHHRAECEQGRVSGIDGDGIGRLEESIQAFARLARRGRQTNGLGADLEHHQAGIARGKPAERSQERRLTMTLQPDMGGAIFRHDQPPEEPRGNSILRNGLGIAEDVWPDSRHIQPARSRSPREQAPFAAHEAGQGSALSVVGNPWLSHKEPESIRIPAAALGVPGSSSLTASAETASALIMSDSIAARAVESVVAKQHEPVYSAGHCFGGQAVLTLQPSYRVKAGTALLHVMPGDRV